MNFEELQKKELPAVSEESGVHEKANLKSTESFLTEGLNDEQVLNNLTDELETAFKNWKATKPGEIARMRYALQMRELKREAGRLLKHLPPESDAAIKYLSRLDMQEHGMMSGESYELSEDEQKVLKRGKDAINPQGDKKTFWDRIKGSN